jgi:hypothetical protein
MSSHQQNWRRGQNTLEVKQGVGRGRRWEAVAGMTQTMYAHVNK